MPDNDKVHSGVPGPYQTLLLPLFRSVHDRQKMLASKTLRSTSHELCDAYASEWDRVRPIVEAKSAALLPLRRAA